jgi:HK97 family phage major capsid protein
MIERDAVATMRRHASIYNMTRQQHNIPTAGAVASAMVLEGTIIPNVPATFSQIPLVAQKCATMVVLSQEMLADSAFNLMQVIGQRAGGSIAGTEDEQFWELGGGAAPDVSSIYLGTNYLEITTGTIAYGDLVAMLFTLKKQYRQNAAWYGNSQMLAWLSELMDGNGRPLLISSIETPAVTVDDPGQEGTILRKPVYEVPTATGVLHLADLRQGYAVGSRSGIRSTASEHAQFSADLVELKFTSRFDGNNVDSEAGQTASGITQP